MPAKFNPGKSAASWIDNGVFIIAACMLFLKTSELLAIFAPANIAGFTNLGWLYGIICALLVEGVLVAAKFTLPHNTTGQSFNFNLILIFVTFAISAAAQVIDGFIVKETLSQQPAEIQFVVNYGVPLVPSLVLALVLGKSVFAAMPENTDVKSAGSSQRSVAPSATTQYAAEVEIGTRRNELTAEDKDTISRMSPRQIRAKYGGSMRRAREWKAAAKDGSL